MSAVPVAGLGHASRTKNASAAVGGRRQYRFRAHDPRWGAGHRKRVRV